MGIVRIVGWSMIGLILVLTPIYGPVLYLWWLWGTPEPSEYVLVRRVIDERSGLVIEVGDLTNWTSLCTVVNVFDDPRTERTDAEANNRQTVFFSCGVRDHSQTRVSFEDGCYVLTISARSIGHFNPVWKDDQGKHEMCFRLNRPTTDPLPAQGRALARPSIATGHLGEAA